jgi:hypothetical protein
MWMLKKQALYMGNAPDAPTAVTGIINGICKIREKETDDGWNPVRFIFH